MSVQESVSHPLIASVRFKQVEPPVMPERSRDTQEIESAMSKTMYANYKSDFGGMYMNSVGIDVSKGKSMVAVLRPMGELVAQPYEVCHTEAELESLAYFLKGLDGETRVIMEYTGKYYEPVAKALHNEGIYVSVVNPILINGYGNNSVRRVKTDKKDALKIARYGLDNWVELREYTPVEAAREEIKRINRQYGLYNKVKVTLKNNLIALLDQSYPGANTLFDSPVRADGHEKWVDFVTTFWHCDCICRMSEKAFTERFTKWCHRHGYHFTKSSAEDAYISAAGLFPTLPKNAHTKLLITGAAQQLTAISAMVETFRAELLRLAKLLPEYPVVMDMYGAGHTLGPQLMAEIGDVRRFAHKKSLVAYAGIDAPPFQSGKYDAKGNKISKRGPAPLRKALFQVMSILIRNKPADEPVYQFLDKKRSEGKPYYVYMTAAENKFLRIYYAKVKEYLALLDSKE